MLNILPGIVSNLLAKGSNVCVLNPDSKNELAFTGALIISDKSPALSLDDESVTAVASDTAGMVSGSESSGLYGSSKKK